jgi:hypothetical protein
VISDEATAETYSLDDLDTHLKPYLRRRHETEF